MHILADRLGFPQRHQKNPGRGSIFERQPLARRNVNIILDYARQLPYDLGNGVRTISPFAGPFYTRGKGWPAQMRSLASANSGR